MALVVKNFATQSGGPFSNHFNYEEVDTEVNVVAADYFLPVYDRLTVGDLICSTIDVDGTPAIIWVRVATASADGVTVDGTLT
jgi:hypothetical protein